MCILIDNYVTMNITSIRTDINITILQALVLTERIISKLISLF